MTRVFLVRHGETEWNATGRLQGSVDIPLNANGTSQAEDVAAALAPQLAPGTRIFASHLGRAVSTAQAIASAVGTEVHIDTRLGERDYGVWEGLTMDERYERNPEEVPRREQGLEPLIEGYENHATVAARVTAAIEEHADGEHTVFVSHGSALRMAIHALLGIPLDSHVIGALANTSWSELERQPDGSWKLERHGAIAVPAPRSADVAR